MFPFFKRFLPLLVFVGAAWPSVAAEPFFQPHDVVAFVGGADLVAISEYGYLELLLTRARPAYQLRFRSLAWEGDTVFEQRRDLNFPPLEEQLTKIGATVVIAQFGQMESFAGKEKLPDFIAACEALLGRLSGGPAKQRRILLLSPVVTDRIAGRSPEATVATYSQAVGKIAEGRGIQFIDFTGILLSAREAQTPGKLPQSAGYAGLATKIARRLGIESVPMPPAPAAGDEVLRATIIAKNRLWFDYWRPQNWAFLNGDRTVQPSSRDHLDPSKRWFPEEIEQFLPLIAAKEREIDALAAKLTKP